jgi:hypothetical protein
MSDILRYLMDKRDFYLNPECPDLDLSFSSPEEFTVADVRNLRIPVRIFREGRLVEPRGTIPKDVLQDTKVLADSAQFA